MNNCICHFSPLVSETDVILADGDVVKIDMGAHIDGFIAVVAHTVVVGSSASNPVTGKKVGLHHTMTERERDINRIMIARLMSSLRLNCAARPP